MLDKMVDLVRAFVKEPQIGIQQFFNTIIMGDAGTGKTRLADVLGSAMAQLGMYVYDDVVECTTADFVARTSARRAPRCGRFFDRNTEKVIFLDEAYSLTEYGTALDQTGSSGLLARGRRPS